ncbi:MAG: chromate transporter, partial [Eubacteriales bacterium]|nr:chromate transporter [Eubacteriales bacterium]
MIYLQLAFEFFKAGLFAVGSGLATLPFLMQMSVKYPQWFSLNELMQMVAISESTPGSIGVNMATYVGFHIAGLPGALTATFSLVLPSFTVILIVVHVLDRFKNSRLIN